MESGTRHRFRTLERRLEHSLTSLDSAQRTLDASFFDISERVDELEGLATGTAQALQQGLQEFASMKCVVFLMKTQVFHR
jgi:hypothetical protein